MEIVNVQLNKFERSWLSTMLTPPFAEKELLVRQINNANITKNYYPYDITIHFDVTKDEPPVLTKERVPIEMRLFHKDKAPTIFLLHILKGYLSELEIFNADSSKIDKELIITDKRNVTIILAQDLITKI